MRDIRQNRRLFTTGLHLGTTVFGGVTQAYPIIRSIGWIPAEEVDELYAISLFLPGPSFLNLWGAVSSRVAGLPGAIAGQVGLILPSFVLVLALPLLARVPWVAARAHGAMAGAAWATAGLLLATGVEGFRKLKRPLYRGLTGGALALLLLRVHPLLVLAGSMALGAFTAPAPGRSPKERT